MLSLTCLSRRSLRVFSQNFVRLSSGAAPSDAVETELVNDESDDREAVLEARRNKSRLAPWHYRMLHAEKPENFPDNEYGKTVHFQRKMLAAFGTQTGLNLGIAWPSHKELDEIKEYESVCYPLTLQQMVEKSRKKRLEEEESWKKRERQIEENMSKLETWKRDVRTRKEKKLAEARASQEKKERLIEEVRQYFGYRVDPKSEKFKELLEKKEKEQKKLEKESKKQEKFARAMARLQQTTTSEELAKPSDKTT